MLGPRWHCNWDVRLEYRTNTSDRNLRREDGSSRILYHKGTNGQGYDYWEGKGTFGAPYVLTYIQPTPHSAWYEMTFPDSGIKYTFNYLGRPTTIQYPNGNQITATYDGSNRVSRVDFGHSGTDIDNRYLTFAYTSINYTDEDGNPVTRDRLISVTQQPLDEVVVSYEYDSHGMLHRVKNKFGEVVEEYVTELPAQVGYWKRVIHEIKARGDDGNLHTTRKYYYGQQRHLTKVMDGAGAEIFHLDTDYGYLSTAVMHTGVKHAYTLDVLRNIKEMQVLSESDEELQTLNQYYQEDATFGNTSVLPTVKVSGTNTTTTYEYVDPDGTPAERMHVKKITHPDGTTETFSYNSDWKVTEHNMPLGRTYRYGYDSNGNKVWSRDPEGNHRFNTYDSYGRLTKTEDPTSATSHFAYNTIGQVTVTTSTEGRATTNEYNDRDLLTTVTATGIKTVYAYDSRDRLTTVTDHLGNSTGYTYDAMGRKVAQTDPLSNTTQYVYNTTGTLRNVIFPDDTMTTSTYDFNNRLVQWTNPRGNSWSYAYDGLGRMTTETTPLAKTKVHSYVAIGCGCGGSGGHGVGKIASTKDYAGNYTYFEYDIMGRLKKKTFSGISEYVEHTYDAAGRRTATLDTRLPSADLGGQTFQWAYDLNDRVTTETYPDGSTIVRAFDALGRRTSMTDPDGNTTTYNYANTSNNKKLSSIVHPFGGTHTFDYRNTTDGLLELESYGNNNRTEYTYDSAKRLSRIAHQWQDWQDIRAEQYTYNAASIPVRVDSNEVYTNSYRLYTYDKQLRLKSEDRYNSGHTRNWGRWYEFDAGGNRTQMRVWNGSTTATTTYSYNVGDQLATDSNFDYTYDNNGNLIRKARDEYDMRYLHNSDNRLTKVQDREDFDPDVSYYYDDAGRRILSYSDYTGIRIRWWYDGLNTLLMKEKPSGGSWRTKKVYTLKQASLGAIVSEREMTAWNGSHQPTSWLDRWFHHDRLGNVLTLTDSADGIVAQYEQDAFGNVVSGGQAGFHLTTKEWDADAGLYYFWQRWYDPGTGRFLQVAPTDPGAEMRYGLAENNPIELVDPTGEFWNYGKCLYDLHQKKKKCSDVKFDSSCLSNDDAIRMEQIRREAQAQCLKDAQSDFDSCVKATSSPPIKPSKP